MRPVLPVLSSWAQELQKLWIIPTCHEEGYFHYECDNINMSFDEKINSCTFMYNLHATDITNISELSMVAHSLSQLTFYDIKNVGFEVLIAVVMKSSAVFWDIRLFSPFKVNRCFGGTYHLHLQGHSLPLAFTLVSCSAYSTLKMEAICSSEMSDDFQ
jgi:hypothetical protein